MVSFLSALLFVLGVVVPSLAAKETKRVLIVYSQEKGTRDRGICAAFCSNRFFEVQLYTSRGESGLAGTFNPISTRAVAVDSKRAAE